MYELPKGVRYGLFVATLFMTNFIIMTDFVIYPIVEALYSQFPDDVNGVNFIVSGPSIIIVATSLVIPVIMRHVDRKLLLVGGCIAFAVSAIGGCAIQSVPYMIACRSVGGITYAIAQVCAISIIADYWPEEKKRATMVGFYNTAQAVAGAILSFVSGSLAVNGWTASYNTYWIAVPVLIMVALFVPTMKGHPQGSGFPGKEKPRETKQSLGGSFWLMVACFTVYTTCYMIAVVSFISVYVAENELGSPAFAGVLTSLTSIGSAIMCALFGKVFSRLEYRASWPFYIVGTLCILVLYLVYSIPATAACCLIAGGCFGSLFSYNYAVGSSIVPADGIDRATGVVTAAYGLAVFVTTYIATFLMDAFGTGRVTDVLIVMFIASAVAGVAEMLRTRRQSS